MRFQHRGLFFQQQPRWTAALRQRIPTRTTCRGSKYVNTVNTNVKILDPWHRFDHFHVLTLLKLGPLILGQVLFLISTCIHCTKRCQSSSRIDRILLGSQYEHLTSSPQFVAPPLRTDFASPLLPQSSQICEK